MGVLLDREYWVNVTNQLWKERTARFEVLPAENVLRMITICCKALSDLASDTDFDHDLKRVAETAAVASDGFPIANFLAEFERAERAILIQAGVDERAAEELGALARLMLESVPEPADDPFDAARFRDLALFAQTRSCDAAKSLLGAQQDVQHGPLWHRCFRTVNGVATVSLNVTVPADLTLVEPFTGAASTYLFAKSIKAGEEMVKEGWSGAF